MSNLAQTSSVVKKIFNGFLMVLAAAILFFIATQIFNWVRNSFWPVTFPPSVAFGKIPLYDISEGVKPPSGVNYTLNTINGNLPALPAAGWVFKTTPASPSTFGDVKNASTIASEAGFTAQPSFDPPIATFVDGKDPSKILKYDTSRGTFSLESSYATNADVLYGKPPTNDDALSLSNSFINIFGLNSANFPKENIVLVPYKVEGSNLIKTNTLEGANVVQVNFNRADINKIPVYYPRVVNPEVWVLMSGKNVIAAKSYAWDVEKYFFASYPLKGVQKAFEELKAGNATYNKLLSDDDPAAPNPQTEFNVFDISLGYLITEKLQPYLEPVYVFKGDKGQVAYVRAIDDSWIDAKAPTN